MTEKIREFMAKKTTTKKITPTLKSKLRDEFVQGVMENDQRIYPTLDDLKVKHKVAQSSLYRLAKDDNWKSQRDKFQQDLAEKLDAQRTKDLVNRSKKFDDQSINLATAFYTTVGQVLAYNNNQIQNGREGLKPTQINALANTIATAQRFAKLALGEATDNINATVNENTDSFRRAMELLDHVEDQRRTESSNTTH